VQLWCFLLFLLFCSFTNDETTRTHKTIRGVIGRRAALLVGMGVCPAVGVDGSVDTGFVGVGVGVGDGAG